VVVPITSRTPSHIGGSIGGSLNDRKFLNLRHGQGNVGVLYPGYRGSLVTTEKSGYDRFTPAANGWRTINIVLDMTPALLTKE
jgi:hypothetical protein